jgi:DNA-directed RNA polymerase specialized sigma24 family protein
MTLQESSNDSDSAGRPDALTRCAIECQQAFRARHAAPDDAQLVEHYRNKLDELWGMLRSDLLKIARGWTRSNMGDLDSLALGLFAEIVFELPELKLDPTRNVRNFLKTVARRGLIDQYRSLSDGPKPSKAAEDTAEAVAQELRMWPAASVNPPRSSSLDQQAETADPQSLQIEEQLVKRIDQQTILRTIWEYWPRVLEPDDLKIVRLRWLEDPPGAFRDIATALGPGWMEDTVRQRHHRIMKDTRKYLRELGLIDDDTLF